MALLGNPSTTIWATSNSRRVSNSWVVRIPDSRSRKWSSARVATSLSSHFRPAWTARTHATRSDGAMSRGDPRQYNGMVVGNDQTNRHDRAVDRLPEPPLGFGV